MPLMYIIILKSFYSKEDSLNNVNRLVTKKVILFYYSTLVNFLIKLFNFLIKKKKKR